MWLFSTTAALFAVCQSHGDQNLLGVCRRAGRAGRRDLDRLSPQTPRHGPSRGGRRRSPGAKHVVPHYRVRRRTEQGTWLEIELETGRTHQICIQAASRGHAVLGDSQYGSTTAFGQQTENIRDRAIALHARQLAFRHPMTDQPVDVVATHSLRLGTNCN